MRISKKVVFQMTDNPGEYIEISRDSFDYSGPVAEAQKKSASPEESQGYGLSAQERSGRDSALAEGNQEMDATLSNPLGTPYGTALMTRGTQSVNSAYNNAQSNSRARGNASGFGYAQPVSQGSSDQIEGQRAGAMANLPGQVAQQAIQPDMQAAQSRINEASAYNPTAYYNDANQLTRDRLNQPSGWGAIANLGVQGLGMGLKASGMGGYGNNG